MRLSEDISVPKGASLPILKQRKLLLSSPSPQSSRNCVLLEWIWNFWRKEMGNCFTKLFKIINKALKLFCSEFKLLKATCVYMDQLKQQSSFCSCVLFSMFNVFPFKNDRLPFIKTWPPPLHRLTCDVSAMEKRTMRDPRIMISTLNILV